MEYQCRNIREWIKEWASVKKAQLRIKNVTLGKLFCFFGGIRGIIIPCLCFSGKITARSNVAGVTK